ncbi:hypothetical protein B296_00011318 [Ensete ventricosum]|uniref:Uncharacterized protein n=1 Tax=Ensete ventricosum TaxID=4639 RepID=A0A426ZP01_ENSVE|nr:hypothetical protein B296_00011318 [Ensete ventricosum]
MNGHATMSEDGPILEEFIPLKPSSASSEDRSVDGAAKKSGSVATRADEKLDWLRSVQLWNQEADAFGKVVRQRSLLLPSFYPVDARRIGGAFHPFERVKHVAAPVPASSSTTSGKGGVGGGGEEKEKEGQPQPQPHRKARRCWSPELHQRFLHALKQLGGPHALEIFEDVYMFVISLLQKFRLHNRRPSAAVRSSNTTNLPIPQFVVVSGIWVPPPDYTVAAPPAAAPCTPASLPSDSRVQPQQSKQSDRSPTGPQLEKGGRSEESNSSGNAAALNSLSPVTSSSSQTTTASHPLHRS